MNDKLKAGIIAMPLISVIVPVYNVARYLPRCLDSLINQTYKNIEIILVDDGSTDSSGEICDEYGEKYKNIRVVHQVNSGVSIARNRALDMANGEYIGFVDSDDYVDEDMYEFLYLTLTNSMADIAACSCRDIYANKTLPYGNKRHVDILSAHEAVIREIDEGIYIGCTKLFSKSSLLGIRFLEEYVNGEDRLFVIEAIMQSKYVAYNLQDKYNYCHRQNSAGTKLFTAEDYKLLDICNKIKTIFICNNIHRMAVADKQINLARLQLLMMMDCEVARHKPYGSNLVRDIRFELKKIILSNEYSGKEKIKFILLAISPKLFSIVKKIIKNDTYLFQ